MSRKRTTAESNNDEEQRNECSDSILQNGNNAKRAKFVFSSDTTLQDLPIEMLERILVQAVVLAVKNMKMAKCVWKEKAGLVIIRLATVCSQWSNILTTDYFRNEVNGILDGTAQETTCLEMLYRYTLPFEVSKVTANKDEIFLLLKHAQGDLDRVINVYNRNNMAEVKDVILLPRRNAKAIEACTVSKCLYVLFMDFPGLSMFRLTRDEDHHQFNISPWISDPEVLSRADVSVSAHGSLMIASDLKQRGIQLIISVYNADGFLQHKIELPRDGVGQIEYVESVMQKPDGNFVVVSQTSRTYRKLTEIDTRGNILRQHQSTIIFGLEVVAFADNYGRITMSASHVEHLDSEFNPMDFDGSKLNKRMFIFSSRLHCDISRNEILDVAYVNDDKFKNSVLTIFRLT